MDKLNLQLFKSFSVARWMNGLTGSSAEEPSWHPFALVGLQVESLVGCLKDMFQLMTAWCGSTFVELIAQCRLKLVYFTFCVV